MIGIPQREAINPLTNRPCTEEPTTKSPSKLITKELSIRDWVYNEVENLGETFFFQSYFIEIKETPYYENFNKPTYIYISDVEKQVSVYYDETLVTKEDILEAYISAIIQKAFPDIKNNLLGQRLISDLTNTFQNLRFSGVISFKNLQGILHLKDWDITLEHQLADYFENADTLGEVNHDSITRKATISILEGRSFRTGGSNYSENSDILHEMFHLVFSDFVEFCIEDKTNVEEEVNRFALALRGVEVIECRYKKK